MRPFLFEIDGMEFSKEGSANFFVSNRFILNNMHEVDGMKNLEKYKLMVHIYPSVNLNLSHPISSNRQ